MRSKSSHKLFRPLTLVVLAACAAAILIAAMVIKKGERSNRIANNLPYIFSSSSAAATSCSSESCPDRVLVKFRRPVEQIGLENIQTFVEQELQLQKPVTVREVGGLNVVSITSPGLDASVFTKKFNLRSPDDMFAIEFAEPDFTLRLHSLPDDEFFNNQWGLSNTGQTLKSCDQSQPTEPITGTAGADIHVTDAWGKTQGSKDIVVAIIDTGINFNHPDLKDNVWSADMPFDLNIGGVPVHCAKGSHGFNAITNTCDPTDNDGHGTHIAGIIGAVADNKIGVAGIIPHTSLMAVKAFQGTSSCVSQIANAIYFLTQVKRLLGPKANIRVLNNSYGFAAQKIGLCEPHENCESKTLKAAVELARDNDMLFVASAGNDKLNTDCDPVYPASFNLSNIISVAATTNTDELADRFSNFGPQSVHLGAPGVNICSTGKDSGYNYKEGTSMAAPFVSGAAALVLSRCNLSTGDLKKDLLDNVDHPPLLNGKFITNGRLNIGKAVNGCP
jgi:thermitase